MDTLAPILMVRRWLDGSQLDAASADRGVNSFLAGLQYESPDVAPPDVATFVDETNSNKLATGTMPDVGDFPKILVQYVQPAEWDGEVHTVYRDTEDVRIAITLALGPTTAVPNPEPDALTRQAYYYARAIGQSIHHLTLPANAVVGRQRLGVCLGECNFIQTVPPATKLEDADNNLMIAVVTSWEARDTLPGG